MKTRIRLLSASLAVLVMSGCASIGPKMVRDGHYPYNQAVACSHDEQLLLNLVRLRYRDNPYFLELKSINSSYVIGADASAGIKFPNLSTQNAQSAGLGAKYSESPTISYAPLQGADYVKQLLKTIPTKRLLELSHSGWSIERILKVCVQKINEIENAPSAAGPTPEYAPEYKDFAMLASQMRVLQQANLLSLEEDPDYDQLDPSNILDPGKSVFFRFERTPEYDPVVEHIYSMMNVTPENDAVKITGNFLKPYKPNRIKVKTRTLLGVMFYLSQSVQVPFEHMDRGLVTITTDEAGNAFNWCDVTGTSMMVYSSKSKPKDASVAVKYRGHWFYIADHDLNSKSSFMLLSKLFNIVVASSGGGATPELTIPLNQGA